MKKSLIMVLLAFTCFIFGCDPIDDGVGDKSVLPYGIKSECPVCPTCQICTDCKEYPKVTILELSCKNIKDLLQCTYLKDTCNCSEFQVYKIEMSSTTEPIFLVTKSVYSWEGGTTITTGYLGKSVSELVIGQRYKYWPNMLSAKYCLFQISSDGNSLVEWNWGD
jgi:hypothetical protein